MSKVLLAVLMMGISLAGCAHRGAVRVDCAGPLRPINRPVPSADAKLTPDLSSPNSRPAAERKP